MIRLVLLHSLIFIFNYGDAQETAHIFIGINISNVKQYVVIDGTKTDSAFDYRQNLILPTFDVQKQVKLTTNLYLGFGLGIGWYGANDFNKDAPPQFNIDEDLKIGYLQLPFEILFEPIKKVYILTGYSLCYPFRKNVNFETLDRNNKVINIYTPIHHFVNFGIRKLFDNVSLDLKYDIQLNTLFDSKDYVEGSRGYAKVENINFGISWFIK